MDLLVAVVSMLGILLLFAFWAWMFWDMTNQATFRTANKYYWTLAFVFLSIFAAVYYYVYEYRTRP